MQKLPIGIQDFSKIREGNYAYVDKTSYLYDLIQKGSIYFLSRPRRFGKSLLISTLEAIFQGRKELFEDLWIAQSDYDWKQYPVIRIDMGQTVRTSPELLEQSLINLLKTIADQYQVDLGAYLSAGDALNRLIMRLAAQGEKVVILIDEYDKPIVDNISEISLAKAMRNVLRSFYEILKVQDGNLRFLLLTGVSRFSKASIFSELNNLQDITLDNRYASMLGYTQEELEQVFDPWIERLAKTFNHPKAEELAEIQRWYNGYRFSSDGLPVYNPFSTLLLFEQQAYRVHWFDTATPKFLIDLLENSAYVPEQLNYFEVSDQAFGNYDIETLALLPLLYQTGYLTIRHYDPELQSYTLKYPNLEVERSLNEVILVRWTKTARETQDQAIFSLIKALRIYDFKNFFEILKSFLASIPYDLHEPTEAYYHSIFYLIFHLLGYRINAEVHTHQGRIDAVIELKDRVLVFEFKVNQSAEAALKQIHEKKYAAPYEHTGKVINLFGVNISTTERNITEWVSEQL